MTVYRVFPTKILIVVSALLLFGSSLHANTVLWKSGQNLYIKLSKQDKSASGKTPQNSHPIELKKEDVGDALLLLELWDKDYYDEGVAERVFTVQQARLLAEHISGGLRIADVNQDIVFAIVGRKKGSLGTSETVYTAGRAFYLDGMLNIILGLLDQNRGEILVNDEYRLDEIKNNFQSFLPQKIFMLDNTIKANIVFDHNEQSIDEKRFNKVIKDSKLKEFIESLKFKTDEKIGENATKLSGGQMQRLAIARAIYHDAQLIIFDEPTSSLDKENEKEIFENINSLKQNKILIIISHSDEVSKYVDHKILIKDNQVTFY